MSATLVGATLIFGGTFDPVHVGHLRSARALVNLFEDARLVMIPCQIPPHRPQPVASPEDRYQMLQLAVADESNIDVDDCELKREGPSFTWDTLNAYRDRLGEDAPLYFVLGQDAWVTLPNWYRWQGLGELAHLIVLQRPGVSPDESDELKAWAEPRLSSTKVSETKPSGHVCPVTLEQIAVSASEVRDTLARGGSIEDFVPDAVNQYIQTQHLYLVADSSDRRQAAQTDH